MGQMQKLLGFLVDWLPSDLFIGIRVAESEEQENPEMAWTHLIMEIGWSLLLISEESYKFLR